MRLVNLLLFLWIPASLFAQDLFIQGERVFTGQGDPICPGYLRIQGERIVEILPGKPPEGSVLTASAKVIFPGFIDAHCFIGCAGNLEEDVFVMTPQFRAEDGYNPYDPEIQQKLEHGITSFFLAPGDGNILSGRMALICPASPQNYLLRSELALKCSFSRQTLLPYRNPTSLMGATYELASTLKKNPLLLDLFLCDHPTQVPLAFQWIRQQGGKGMLSLKEGAYSKELPELLKEQHYTQFLILQVPDWNSSQLALQMPARLQKAGFRFAFASHHSSANPKDLLLGVNLAIHYGLNPSTALKAITQYPALLFQAEKDIGSLAPGTLANFILADDLPLNLSAHIQCVFVKGKKIDSQFPPF
ncbi:MAG: amidohydrolase family protein [Planctomycetota bacterium]